MAVIVKTVQEFLENVNNSTVDIELGNDIDFTKEYPDGYNDSIFLSCTSIDGKGYSIKIKTIKNFAPPSNGLFVTDRRQSFPIKNIKFFIEYHATNNQIFENNYSGADFLNCYFYLSGEFYSLISVHYMYQNSGSFSFQDCWFDVDCEQATFLFDVYTLSPSTFSYMLNKCVLNILNINSKKILKSIISNLDTFHYSVIMGNVEIETLSDDFDIGNLRTALSNAVTSYSMLKIENKNNEKKQINCSLGRLGNYWNYFCIAENFIDKNIEILSDYNYYDNIDNWLTDLKNVYQNENKWIVDKQWNNGYPYFEFAGDNNDMVSFLQGLWPYKKSSGFYFGNKEIKDLYYGDKPVYSLYYGNKLIWKRETSPPPPITPHPTFNFMPHMDSVTNYYDCNKDVTIGGYWLSQVDCYEQHYDMPLGGNISIADDGSITMTGGPGDYAWFYTETSDYTTRTVYLIVKAESSTSHIQNPMLFGCRDSRYTAAAFNICTYRDDEGSILYDSFGNPFINTHVNALDYHVCVLVRDGNNNLFYVDGELRGTVANGVQYYAAADSLNGRDLHVFGVGCLHYQRGYDNWGDKVQKYFKFVAVADTAHTVDQIAENSAWLKNYYNI